MPRVARKKSRTGIYHIMIRGINRQNIFQDDEDREKFLQTVARYTEKGDIKIYGYCLMNNHVHILIKDTNLAVTMRKICASYVYWYNRKYKRCGHLYQDRFKSEVVEDDKYFLTVLRYIHQNPVKAGLVKSISDYKWSSFDEYLNTKKIVDVDFALEIMSKEQFVEYNNAENQDSCLEYKVTIRIEDNEARQIIKGIAKVKNVNEIKNFEKAQREKIIKQIKNDGRVSIRQISRVTGISYNSVRTI